MRFCSPRTDRRPAPRRAPSVVRSTRSPAGRQLIRAPKTYAVEGEAFVLAPCAVVGQAGHDLFCDTDVNRQLLLQGGGSGQIHGPEGSVLAQPLEEHEEGIL